MPALNGYMPPGYNLPTLVQRPFIGHGIAPVPYEIPKLLPEPDEDVIATLGGFSAFAISLYSYARWSHSFSLIRNFTVVAPFVVYGHEIWLAAYQWSLARAVRIMRADIGVLKATLAVRKQELRFSMWRGCGYPILLRTERLRGEGRAGLGEKEMQTGDGEAEDVE
jgi:hypothetical protein